MPRNVLDMPTNIVASEYYSAAVRAGDLIFVSGQGPRDPITGKFAGESIEDQTELTLNCVKAVLSAAGASMDDVVKANVHLQDINHFDRFNLVYARFFKSPRPARTTVGSNVGELLVEIDVVANVGPR